MKYYVYVYLDPRKAGTFEYGGEFKFDYEPFYVGKGQGKRKDSHIRNCNLKQERNLHKLNKINKIMRLGFKPIIIVVKDNMLEEDAFQLEKDLIKLIGRNDKKLGTLVNLTDGGEGATGAILSEERKERLRQQHLGMKASDDTKKKMSDFQKQRYAQMTDEEKLEFIERCKSCWTEEMKEEVRLKYLGDKNPNFGNRWDDTQRKKLSDHQKIHGVFITHPENNPQVLNPKYGDNNSNSKYVYALYNCEDGLISLKSTSIYEIINKYPYLEEGKIIKTSITNKFYKGFYIERCLINNGESLQNITDSSTLKKMRDYNIRYKIGKKLGLDRTLTHYYEFKIYKDDQLVFKTYYAKEVKEKYGSKVLRRFHDTKPSYKGYVDGFVIQRDKLSEEFLNG